MFSSYKVRLNRGWYLRLRYKVGVMWVMKERLKCLDAKLVKEAHNREGYQSLLVTQTHIAYIISMGKSFPQMLASNIVSAKDQLVLSIR